MRCSRFWWYADEKARERISKLLKHGQIKKVLYLQQWHIQWWDEKGFRFQTLSLRWRSKYKATNTLKENLGCEGWYDIKISLKSPFNSHTVVIQFIFRSAAHLIQALLHTQHKQQQADCRCRGVRLSHRERRKPLAIHHSKISTFYV